MTNADKFKSIFGLYATELWAKSEKDFIEWLNADAELFGNSEQLDDTISRQAAIEALIERDPNCGIDSAEVIKELPPAQPKYEPVKVEDFAKTMSENTIYTFMAWHGEALELMERYGFVICKKTM